MAVDTNADVYASKRLNIFFPAHNQTPQDGNLTGQCVTLNKWFLAEMTKVPDPFSARGHARYVGDTLVAQGHAVEVPFEQRRRGDFVVYKYGTYGHIGVLLSNDRLFEQNVNVAGVSRRLVDGAYVYSSRIGSLSESWRAVKPNIYRIKSYSEGGDMSKDALTKEEVIELHYAYFVGGPGAGYGYEHVGKPLEKLIHDWKSSTYRKNVLDRYYAFDKNVATINQLTTTVNALNTEIKKLTSDDEADKARIAELQVAAADAKKLADELQAQNNALILEKDYATKTGNAFTRWLGEQLNKILGK